MKQTELKIVCIYCDKDMGTKDGEGVGGGLHLASTRNAGRSSSQIMLNIKSAIKSALAFAIFFGIAYCIGFCIGYFTIGPLLVP